MVAIKKIEDRRGKRFTISDRLSSNDEVVVPKVTAVYMFLFGKGEGTLQTFFFSIPHRVGAFLTSFSHYIEKKIELIHNSSRGRRQVDQVSAPQSEFLKNIGDYKDKSKEESPSDLQ
jgi:hypothetical protein